MGLFKWITSPPRADRRCSGPDPSYFDRQVAGAAQDRAAAVRGRILDEAGAVQAADEFGQRDLRLDPGEGRPEADVHAAAKAEVLIILAGRVEGVGGVEAPPGAAAGGEHQEERRALGNGGTGTVHIGERRALR